jgi:hypothetical protein
MIPLGLACLVVILRYRSLIPLAFWLSSSNRPAGSSFNCIGPSSASAPLQAPNINAALLGIMALGLVLSLWRPRAVAGGA